MEVEVEELDLAGKDEGEDDLFILRVELEEHMDVDVLHERENEVWKLNQKELCQVQQDKVSLEDILSAACVLTTQYKAEVESMDVDLNNTRTQLQLIEAEKITLTAKLLEAILAHLVPVSESLLVLLQDQQEARSQDNVDVGMPD
ncbi:hypothetical protein C0993_010825 [Termitomyces sp. T159_Od127]|nr:hypothetical protein C0993_010825 [Termitomyces sp. T159_Od127]